MVCLVIFATQGLYLWHDLAARDKVRSSLDYLARSIEATRILALEHNSTFALCASTDGINCNTSWRGGLLITDDNNKKFLYGSNLYLPCDLSFKGRLIDNKIIFTSSGFTSGIQGRFYCTVNSLHRTFSLLVRINGSVGDVVESNIN
jgi:Tfp pilus assembly protein FimT